MELLYFLNFLFYRVSLRYSSFQLLYCLVTLECFLFFLFVFYFPKISCCVQYSQLGQLSVGPISYAEDENGKLLPLTICKEYYRRGSVEPSDEIYDIDAQLETGERENLHVSLLLYAAKLVSDLPFR